MTYLPHALDKNFPLFKQIPGKEPALFLDFDGTLTPIVGHPSQAILSEDTRGLLRGLAEKITVAIISGRGRKELAALVNIPELYYGGAHGLDLKGPGVEKIPEEVLPILPTLQEAAIYFQKESEKFPGAWVEDKKYGVALHYRLMDPSLVPALQKEVEGFAQAHTNLKMTSGKKIFELRPNVEWDKGLATLYLLKTLKLEGEEYLPIFLGDDETDEDAFRILKDRGWGILVDPVPETTSAQAYLRSADEVRVFLQRLLQNIS